MHLSFVYGKQCGGRQAAIATDPCPASLSLEYHLTVPHEQLYLADDARLVAVDSRYARFFNGGVRPSGLPGITRDGRCPRLTGRGSSRWS